MPYGLRRRGPRNECDAEPPIVATDRTQWILTVLTFWRFSKFKQGIAGDFEMVLPEPVHTLDQGADVRNHTQPRQSGQCHGMNLSRCSRLHKSIAKQREAFGPVAGGVHVFADLVRRLHG